MYHHKNRRKYNLQAHLVLVTKYRKPLLKNDISEHLKTCMLLVANKTNFTIVAMETDFDHIHILMDYDATVTVCDLVKIIKQETTRLLWHKYNPELRTHYWKRKILWSDGYFICSVGDASSQTIEKYIASQG